MEIRLAHSARSSSDSSLRSSSGRRGHAVAALSQVNIVEVPLQNLLLGVSLVKAQGGKDLQNLPFYRHIVVLGGILDELLGDGGAALNIAAGEHEQHPLRVRFQLTPWCFQNVSSSMATVALIRLSGISSKSTSWRFSVPWRTGAPHIPP